MNPASPEDLVGVVRPLNKRYAYFQGISFLPKFMSGMWEPNKNVEAFEIKENLSGEMFVPEQVAPYYADIGQVALELSVSPRQFVSKDARAGVVIPRTESLIEDLARGTFDILNGVNENAVIFRAIEDNAARKAQARREFMEIRGIGRRIREKQIGHIIKRPKHIQNKKT